ncbi:hypothetical protein Kpol_1002p72 [Vanderwaltozyma polyspora DSM 70294]|uniref:Spc7 kinetochore protein domain-containing protein n=1 Tax=Vanderwaltozyma polyspora (strain ATCC 22028 / DSM 70294 / BCRC 21397 / CBS 2163 / NBRC 10782 / NRRL Y-8283 / UCD 57-17) TaxID=436907 RepID=A7TEA3_VANPO|nr:uncharacterized protein Kpol_1002p72 [Vanderwaltozyma polyspora DSM 70294]EDO19425.1 hypothetical protein Kpol_1002p72 [Vanderwaltozyma polyspora DSM 70294]
MTGSQLPNDKGIDQPAKGILKSDKGNNGGELTSDGVVTGSINLPLFPLTKSDVLEGNNTTSRINTINLQNKINRRVSFAPDVTLHSFDFVPEQNRKQREPRRKVVSEPVNEPIGNDDGNSRDEALVTSTQREDKVTEGEIINGEQKKNDDIEDILNEDLEDDSMDITQLFNKHGSKQTDDQFNEPNELSKLNETMELTKIIVPLKSNTDEQNETMEMTEIQVPQIVDSSQPMDVTEIYQKTQSMDMLENNDGETLEFTEIKVPKLTIKNDKDGRIKPKRRKLSVDGSYKASNEELPENTVEPEDQENFGLEISDDEMELTQMERMSPIKLRNLTGTSTQTNTESDKEKDKTNDKELVISQKTSPFVEGTNDKEFQSYSIKEFLKEINISFKIDNEVGNSDESTLNFTLIDPAQITGIRINQLYNTYYVDIPILEMNTFISKELLRRISQSKVLFEDLEERVIKESPPLLFREYFSSEAEIKNIAKSQLQLVKKYSSLEAKKAWYEWRIQHLVGIKNVLIENLSILKEEFEKVNTDLENIQEIKNKVESLKDRIRQEIKLIRELPPDYYQNHPNLKDKLRLEQLKQELVSHSVKIGQIKELQNKRNDVLTKISKTKESLSQTKLELENSNRAQRLDSHFSEFELNRLKNRFSMFQTLSGIEFVSLKKSTLIVKSPIEEFPEIVIDLSKIGKTKDIRKAVKLTSSNENEFYHYFFTLLLANVTVRNGDNFLHTLSELIKELNSSRLLLAQYKSLEMLFPVSFVQSNDKLKTTAIEITDYDIRTNSKVKFYLSVKDFINLGLYNFGKLFISVKILRGESISKDDLFMRITKKINKLIPWINENSINIVIS